MISARRTTLLLLAALALVLGLAPMAHAAGPNIGDAQVLTGSTNGSLTSAQQDDWYVVYPTAKNSPVTITVKNTTPQVTSCSLEIAAVTSTDGSFSPGTGLGNTDLEATQSKEFDVSGADRYFVELQDNNCNPSSEQPAPGYSVKVTGGGGTPLRGSEEDAAPADNIGDAGPPLSGHVDYRGSITSATDQQWYVFDVTGEAPSVSVRVENTTSRHIQCDPLIVRVTDTFGHAVQSTDITWDTAHEFTIGQAGRYFVQVLSNNCGSAGEPVTYRLQVDPAAQLSQPGTPGRLPLTGGVSKQAAKGPLAGGVDYTDTLPNAATTHWYSVQVNGTGEADVNIENTSKPTAPCGPLIVRIIDQNGAGVGSADLPTDTGYTFATSKAGLYYIELNDNNCDPQGKPPMDVRINVSPPSAVTANPAYDVPRCQSFGVTAVQGTPTPIQLRCTGLGPLTYSIVSGPTHGTLSGFSAATGAGTYTSKAGYGGPDSLIYMASNPFGYLAPPATVAVTVTLAGGTQKGGPGPGGPGGKQPPPKPKTPKIKRSVGKRGAKKGVRRTPRRVVDRKRKAAFRVWAKSQWKELAPVCGSYEIFSEAVSAIELEAGWPGRIAKFVTDKMLEMTLARCKAHLERLLVTYTKLKKDPPSRHYTTVALPAAVRGPTAPKCPRGLPGQTAPLLAQCDGLLVKEAAKDKAFDRVTAIDAALATAIDRAGGARKAHNAAAQRLQYVAVQALLAESGQAMADYARTRRALAAAIGASGLAPRLAGRAVTHPLSAFKALRHDRHAPKAVRQIAALLVAGAHGKASALAPPKTYRAALGNNPSTASIAGAAGGLDVVDLQTLVAGLRHGHQLSAGRAKSLSASLGALAKASKAKRGAALSKVGAQLRATGGGAGTLLRAVTGL